MCIDKLLWVKIIEGQIGIKINVKVCPIKLMSLGKVKWMRYIDIESIFVSIDFKIYRVFEPDVVDWKWECVSVVGFMDVSWGFNDLMCCVSVNVNFSLICLEFIVLLSWYLIGTVCNINLFDPGCILKHLTTKLTIV